MDPRTAHRLFEFRDAFAHPLVLWVTVVVVGLLPVSAVIVWVLHRLGRTSAETHRELVLRIRSWAVLVPLLIGPVLLGAAAVIIGVAVLSALCFGEFARATGLFRDRAIAAVVGVALLFSTYAVADHWYGFFVAVPVLAVSLLAAVAVLRDEPQGYLQRVGLGTVSLLLFVHGLGYLGYLANDPGYRPLLLLVLLTVELNDIFAYLTGRLFGATKLLPKTSPGKTGGGALGALICTTTLVALLGSVVLAGTPAGRPVSLIVLGLLVSIAGQAGDLVLSSAKRDIGVKDMGARIPGHGGLLDRFDSLLLVAPVVFHYVGYFNGVGLSEPTRVLSRLIGIP